MSGHKIFISYTNRDGDKHRAALADALENYGPAVSGVRLNISLDAEAGRSKRALLFVDLCMEEQAFDRAGLLDETCPYFIWFDTAHAKQDSVVWRERAQDKARLFPKAFAETAYCEHFERQAGTHANHKIMLRFLFQAKNSYAASHAAQILCSQLAREDVAEGGSGKAAERIYLWLMHMPDGEVRHDLRLRDLTVFDNWYHLREPCFAVDSQWKAPVDDGGNSVPTERTEALRTAFVSVLRRAARRVWKVNMTASEDGDDGSDVTADYVSAARLLALFYGKAREPEPS